MTDWKSQSHSKSEHAVPDKTNWFNNKKSVNQYVFRPCAYTIETLTENNWKAGFIILNELNCSTDFKLM
jgi:hypothetical protein